MITGQSNCERKRVSAAINPSPAKPVLVRKSFKPSKLNTQQIVFVPVWIGRGVEIWERIPIRPQPSVLREINPIVVRTLSMWVNPAKIPVVNPSVLRLEIIPEPIQVVPVREMLPCSRGDPKRIINTRTHATQAPHPGTQFRQMRFPVCNSQGIAPLAILLGITSVIPPFGYSARACIRK